LKVLSRNGSQGKHEISPTISFLPPLPVPTETQTKCKPFPAKPFRVGQILLQEWHSFSGFCCYP